MDTSCFVENHYDSYKKLSKCFSFWLTTYLFSCVIWTYFDIKRDFLIFWYCLVRRNFDYPFPSLNINWSIEKCVFVVFILAIGKTVNSLVHCIYTLIIKAESKTPAYSVHCTSLIKTECKTLHSVCALYNNLFKGKYTTTVHYVNYIF